MHLKRWLTAVIAVPLLVLMVGFGPRWLFYSVLSAAACIGLREFYAITQTRLPRFLSWGIYLMVLVLFAALYIRQFLLIPAIVLAWAFTPMAWFMFTRPSAAQRPVEDLAKAVLGPVYVALPLGLLVLIDFRHQGQGWIFFLLTAVFASDTGAFYAGKLFGRHKLYEAVSPGKTWEGAVGGLVASVAATCLLLRLTGLHPFGLSIVVLTMALSAAGQIGDLSQSMLKRSHGVKDSGRILPGHGGILDRIDGLLFAIPVLFIYLFFYSM
ncbi:MAG: phosphatidate cytidylyltransferase [Deltaproteobacteria bacterium]|nr:phosphatidate cytidylyltransferase [Deltaproteobacteria bacterium]MBW2353492.1 phosphatidate cytidylyltransferase [Deltaproteobacteria bacterium]HDZ91826.1 phosphatidate cytidylyltransferase [Deltaproteobacteria bacterium]